MLPHVILELPRKEKAFVYACIDVRIKEEKRERDKLDSKMKQK